MLQVGDKLPEFELLNQSGEKVQSKSFLGKKLVMFFYPKASTPGCTTEACNLNDNLAELTKEGYELVGVSGDPVPAQRQFHEKNALQFQLLSDESKETLEKFGVWQMKNFMGREYMGTMRTTFIFDEKGICTRVIDKVKTKTAARQILKES